MKAVLHHDPFPYGWIDGYLPSADYQSLEASFISPDTHPQASTLGKGKKRILFSVPPKPEKLGPLGAAWESLLQAIGSREYLSHCLDWVRQLLPLDRFAPGPYRELFRMRHELGPEDVEMQCEFSNLGSGVHLPPHSDSADKVLTFVYYFAPTGWQDVWGGATEVYRTKNPKQTMNFSNFFVQPDAVECLNRSDYRPNRLFFFAKNDRAWHGVSPLSKETALPRLTFNFSLRTKPEFRMKNAMEKLHAAIRDAEHPAFA